jgi:predicted KAP-like P-loop ATPase
MKKYKVECRLYGRDWYDSSYPSIIRSKVEADNFLDDRLAQLVLGLEYRLIAEEIDEKEV